MTAPGGLVLLTRPADRAAATAERLHGLGLAPLIDPMLRLEDVPADPIAPDAQGILFTSAQAVERWEAIGGRLDLPVWAVGNRTADAARKVGFKQVEAGDGFGDHLADRLMQEVAPGAGPLLWPSGADIAVDLVAALGEVGITVDRRILYRSHAATAFQPETLEELRAGRIACALFYSPKTAAIFAGLIRDAGAEADLRAVRALCLSTAVAEKLEGLPFARLKVAPEPSEDALLALLAPLDEEEQAKDVMPQDESPTPNTPPTLTAEEVIDRFGGLRPMAAKLGVAVSTIQGWKQRGHIPENRWHDVEAAAAQHGISLSPHRANAPEPADSVIVLPPPGAGEAESDEAKAETVWEAESSEPEAEPPAAPDAKGEPEREAEPAPEPSPGPQPPSNTGVATGAAAEAARPAPSSRLAWVALLLAGVALAGAVTRPAWAPKTDPVLARYIPAMQTPAAAPGAAQEAVAALETRLEDMAAKLAALQQAPTAVTNNTPFDAAPLTERLDHLEAGLAELSSRVTAMPATDDSAMTNAMDALREELESLRTETDAAQSAAEDAAQRLTLLSDRIAAAEAGIASVVDAIASLRQDSATRLDDLEKRLDAMADSGGRAAALALAMGDLDRALDTGVRAQETLQQLRLLAANDAEVSTLLNRIEPMLAGPVPSLAELKSRFDAIAPQLQAPEVDTGTSGIIDDVLKNLMSVVSVRRVGDAAELPAAAHAEAALERGDLAAAVSALDGLDGPAAEWVEAARSRLVLDAAKEDLRRLALSRLGAIGEARP